MIFILKHNSEKSQTFEVNLKRFGIPYERIILNNDNSSNKFDEYHIPDTYHKAVYKYCYTSN
jgi:hypothetical protein